ncbi:MAG TPA: hypothetical protein DIT56_00675 [Candidatus Moranbacteria bacterium]|nr:hypothetical protein [Candidatus Moranbacteria bacterium]
MTFAREQIEIKKELEKAGHKVLITDDIESFAKDEAIKQSFEEELKLCLECDVIRSFFNKIAESDAYLVCNYEKNDIKGYLGASVLMEIGLAYYLKKKIYLFSEVDKEQKYALEIAVIAPVVIDGNLNKII